MCPNPPLIKYTPPILRREVSFSAVNLTGSKVCTHRCFPRYASTESVGLEASSFMSCSTSPSSGFSVTPASTTSILRHLMLVYSCGILCTAQVPWPSPAVSRHRRRSPECDLRGNQCAAARQRHASRAPEPDRANYKIPKVAQHRRIPCRSAYRSA